jgi:hypothetical protein
MACAPLPWLTWNSSKPDVWGFISTNAPPGPVEASIATEQNPAVTVLPTVNAAAQKESDEKREISIDRLLTVIGTEAPGTSTKLVDVVMARLQVGWHAAPDRTVTLVIGPA